MTQDKRRIWKNKNDLELMMIIHQFLEKHDIHSVRQYQKFKLDYPNEIPSLWFIQERFDSWEHLLVRLGHKTFDRYRWEKYTNEQLIEIVQDFIVEHGIYAQRRYEKICARNNLPSLSTLKKRFNDVRFLFSKPKDKNYLTDFELLTKLKSEIIRLEMEKTLSMTEFRKKYDRTTLPSVDTIMRRTEKNWEELMEEIGFDYRSIKVELRLKNFR